MPITVCVWTTTACLTPTMCVPLLPRLKTHFYFFYLVCKIEVKICSEDDRFHTGFNLHLISVRCVGEKSNDVMNTNILEAKKC